MSFTNVLQQSFSSPISYEVEIADQNGGLVPFQTTREQAKVKEVVLPPQVDARMRVVYSSSIPHLINLHDWMSLVEPHSSNTMERARIEFRSSLAFGRVCVLSERGFFGVAFFWTSDGTLVLGGGMALMENRAMLFHSLTGHEETCGRKKKVDDPKKIKSDEYALEKDQTDPLKASTIIGLSTRWEKSTYLPLPKFSNLMPAIRAGLSPFLLDSLSDIVQAYLQSTLNVVLCESNLCGSSTLFQPLMVEIPYTSIESAE